jgi:uncharacterized DUF497 family protein
MLTFEWDQKKAERNLRKHGVSFAEASTVFGDPLSIVVNDPDHSDTEERFLIVGSSYKGRLLIVSFTERGSHIRLISARKLTAKEQREYEEAIGR